MGVHDMFCRNLFLGGAVVWLTACGGQAELKTDQQTYAPGSELSLRLENDSLVSLGFNLCFSTLQRHEGETWTPVARPENEACQAIQYRLKPGTHTESRNILDATLPEGEYRYFTTVEWDGEREDVVSNTFSVTRTSTP
jgi:hypothetical protein